MNTTAAVAILGDYTIDLDQIEAVRKGPTPLVYFKSGRALFVPYDWQDRSVASAASPIEWLDWVWRQRLVAHGDHLHYGITVATPDAVAVEE